MLEERVWGGIVTDGTFEDLRNKKWVFTYN